MHRPSMSGTQKLGLLSAMMVSLGLKPVDLSAGDFRPGKHGRNRRTRGRGRRERTPHLRKVCASTRGHIIPRGKINFRRSDPRHPMYDALRALGWLVYDNLTHHVVDGEIVARPTTMELALRVYHEPAQLRAKKGITLTPAAAFRLEHDDRDGKLRIPVCLRGAA